MRLPLPAPTAVLVLLLVTACASNNQGDANASLPTNVTAAATDAAAQTRDGLSSAVTAPLDDLNLRRREIPPLLVAMPSPYHLPEELSCDRIEMDIAELDIVLGLDWDSGKPDRRLNTEVLADEAADAALEAVKDVSTGWIPFRSLLRKATGAESHEKRYNQAFRIGAQRRAYLKGYGLALGCPLPARPDFERLLSEEAKARIDYR
jgi:hypothetical protein